MRTVQRIRTRDTVTPIVGPSYATYEVNRMVLRLVKGSPFFSGATGYAELDYIQLT